MNDRNRPVEVVREELGGDYYYRCPWLTCNNVVKAEFNYCPYCGQRIVFNFDNYQEGKSYGKV